MTEIDVSVVGQYDLLHFLVLLRHAKRMVVLKDKKSNGRNLQRDLM